MEIGNVHLLGRYGLSGCPVARDIFDPQTMRMFFEKTMVGE